MNKRLVLRSFAQTYIDKYKVYPASLKSKGNDFFFMAKDEREKYLVVVGSRSLCEKFKCGHSGELKIGGNKLAVRIACLNHHNLVLLREILSYLSPSTCGRKASFGTGDRLGIVTAAHIQAFKNKDIFPVLAQQSVREMARTGRNWQQVLDNAIWGCFEAGYEGSFGADADHVKRVEDLKEGADCDYTMFTVDPSEFVRKDIFELKDEEISEFYNAILERKELEKLYLGRGYLIEGKRLRFDEKSLREVIFTYFKAIKHTVKCYHFLKSYKKGNFDFEVSVDETSAPTSPLAHIFIAQELQRNKVNFQNLALHFTGEWQKGIDYIGDVGEFARTLSLHIAVATMFSGYKLSLHSGSDKFSIYPAFAQKTKGLFHIKTAGTSYLEAIRVIARNNPSLYREIHCFALQNFAEDRASYHITTDLTRIPGLDKVPDDKLEGLFKNPDSRQLVHITHGSVLNARDKEDGFLFRDRLYKTLFQNENDHYKQVSSHIKRHLDLLKI